MHQLSRREAVLLSAESVTNLGHYSIYLELAPNSDGEALTFKRLRSMVQDRLHLSPSLRRRVRSVPLELDDPWWIEDPHFDIDYHVRHLAIPGADDPDALDQLLGRLHERPLDRNRPLWELYLIDHPDGVRGVFIKVHVVLTDELGPLGPLSLILAVDDVESDEVSRLAPRPDMVPSDSDLMIKASWTTIRSPRRSLQRSLEFAQRFPVVGDLATLLLSTSSAEHPIERARRDQTVPRTSFNRTLSAHRRVQRASLPIDQIREIHQVADVRFHDVLLAVIGGALRHWLVQNDELIATPLVALTPLLIDEADEVLGAALVPLATERHDAEQRLEDVSVAMAEITEQMEPQSVGAIRKREGVPTALAAAASQMLVTTTAHLRFLPPFNVYVVSIPGGDFLDVDGHAVLRKHALCPIIDGIGLSVSAISIGDTIDITLVSDRDLIADLDVIAERLSVELDELHDATVKTAAAV